ncbi:MAG: PD-(D/E)XK nuclease family protein [Candidatus Omnitrophica bacterium]|nr:PD-(D/E)XK nuclease family protein [Candidatus Omnitrophota bacterium]
MTNTNKVLTFPFTESYIENLGAYINENYIKEGKDLLRLAVVFPGKRPGLFLRKALAGYHKKSFLPPQIFNIEQFVERILSKETKAKIIPSLDACYCLYLIAKEECREILAGRESFSEFLPWAEEILSFIEQLDLEMIDNDQLKSVEANAQIGYAVPRDINKLLENIVVLRRDYHRRLKEKLFTSKGLQFLQASSVVAEKGLADFDEALFCNFFYFNKAEEKLVKTLHEQGLARLIFQGDERKWPVLSKIAQDFNCRIEEGKTVPKPDFNLRLISCPDLHSEVCSVREVLKGVKSLNETVVVLPDAENLIPLLAEISPVVEDLNVSLGYPAKRSSLFVLFELTLKSQLSRKKGKYYMRDYLRAMRHPFVKNLSFEGGSAITRVLIHKIEEFLKGKYRSEIAGRIFLSLSEIMDCEDLFISAKETLAAMGQKAEAALLKNTLKTVHQTVFSGWEKVRSFADFAAQLEVSLRLFTQKGLIKQYPLNVNTAERLWEIKEGFEALSFASEDFPLEELFRIFKDRISRAAISFSGTPLKGLQVLGALETRALNFKDVVIMDVNEGTWPKLKVYEPLVPREIKISLRLDSLELEEEIQRYQFMRLISSAENVYLFYQENKEKEKSRFVQELVWEKEKEEKKTGVLMPSEAGFNAGTSAGKRSVKKSPSVIRFLRGHSFSASSLNTYLKDPMEFYFSYVLGLKDQEDLLDEPEGKHIGIFVHELLENCFKRFLNKKPDIDSAFCAYFMGEFEKRFAAAFGNSLRNDDFLLKFILEERLKRFLEKERNNTDRNIQKLLFLEQKFKDTISLSCGDIKFSYIVDRVDLLEDGTIQVIDYKTGSLDQIPKGFATLDSMELSRENIRDNLRSFQLPLYIYYLHKNFPNDKIDAVLYSLRTMEFKRLSIGKEIADYNAAIKSYLRILDFVMAEILNPDIDFIEDKSKTY